MTRCLAPNPFHNRYVFLSNTGEKDSHCVQTKLSTYEYPYKFDGDDVPLNCIHTAMEGQVHRVYA